jgi:hypothetical protein
VWEGFYHSALFEMAVRRSALCGTAFVGKHRRGMAFLSVASARDGLGVLSVVLARDGLGVLSVALARDGLGGVHQFGMAFVECCVGALLRWRRRLGTALLSGG